MFDRLRICILHPRFIGKFIIEKMYKIWILYVILFLLMGILIFFLIHSSAYLTSSEVNYIVTEMAKDEEINLEYKNNSLNGDPKTFTISSGGLEINLCFLEEKINETPFSIVFSNNSCKSYINGILIGEENYSNLTIPSFSIKNGVQITAIDRISLATLISTSFDLYANIISIANALIITGQNIVTLALILLVTFLLTLSINGSIRGKFRFNLLIHCGLISIVIFLLSYMLNIAFLQYVAYVLPLIYMMLALKSIVKLEGAK